MIGKITTFEWTVAHFDLDQIAESGQVFRWERAALKITPSRRGTTFAWPT